MEIYLYSPSMLSRYGQRKLYLYLYTKTSLLNLGVLNLFWQRAKAIVWYWLVDHTCENHKKAYTYCINDCGIFIVCVCVKFINVVVGHVTHAGVLHVA